MTDAATSRAQGAALMVRRYNAVQNDGEKESAVEMLNEMFADIRCHHNPTLGLVTYFNSTKMKNLPHSLTFGSNVVIQVRQDGRGVIQKNRFGLSGLVVPTLEMARRLKISVISELTCKSRVDLINEDWI